MRECIFYWHLVVEISIIFLLFSFVSFLYYTSMECTHHDEKLAAGHHSHNGKRIKKKNSRSKSMFELADNPYADENCCCCNDDHVDASATSTATTRRNSLIYSILTSSTLNHHNDVYTHTATTTSDAMLFLLKFSKLLVSCGAPSHRLDHCLQSLMQKFSVKAQFGYFPGFLVVSFGDAGNYGLQKTGERDIHPKTKKCSLSISFCYYSQKI